MQALAKEVPDGTSAAFQVTNKRVGIKALNKIHIKKHIEHLLTYN